jgi:hypothetical protein
VSVIEAVGESPVSLAVVLLTVAVAFAREVARASRNTEAARLAGSFALPFLGLLVAFSVIVAARVALILD